MNKQHDGKKKAHDPSSCCCCRWDFPIWLLLPLLLLLFHQLVAIEHCYGVPSSLLGFSFVLSFLVDFPVERHGMLWVGFGLDDG
jgi:hypothetical protein